ncbi:Xylan 1,4-beta-xylosidase precursor [compost metagenome]
MVVRAPNADIARDPRWGRTEESYGEDAFFNGTMTVAFVKGLQGNNSKILANGFFDEALFGKQQ